MDAGMVGAFNNQDLNGRFMMGYQGWFGAEGEGSQRNRWRHWATETPTAQNVGFDAWPDMSELSPEELFPTELEYAGGVTASLFSSYNTDTVVRHFAWMKEHQIDGVFLQQFLVSLDPGTMARKFRNKVTQNVKKGAQMHDRVFAFMYDISGAEEEWLKERLLDHWESMVDLGIVEMSKTQKNP